MMTGLRRILTAMLLGVFVSLGVIAALVIGRRPGTRRAAPVPAPDRPATVEAGQCGRGFAFALLALILVAGLAVALYGAGDRLRDQPQPFASGRNLTALSPPTAGGGADPRSDLHASAPAGTVPEAGGAAPADGDGQTEPRFDVVRVEPKGEAVVAGRAGRNAMVDLLVDGRPVAQTRSGPDGQFTLTLSLPTGRSTIGLRMTDAQGHVSVAHASVSVAVAPTRDAMPLVALMQPDAPAVALSRPEPPPAAASPQPTSTPPTPALPAPALPTPGLRDHSDQVAPQAPDAAASRRPESAGGSGAGATKEAVQADAVGRDGDANPAGGGIPAASTTADPHRTDGPVITAAPAPPRIARVDAGSGGRLSVTAQAAPGATVRLYLNETLIAPATVARDGTVTFSIGRGVKPGAYRVRIDQVDAVTGKVRDRAEVPFSAPESAQDVVEDAAPHAVGAPDAGSTVTPPGRPAASAAQAAGGSPGMAAGGSEVRVPGIETARIVRGDSLWKISRRTYGEGDRYTVIYDANQDQIRDPNLIYPGQIFVLPSDGAAGTASGETHE